ncbi:RNA-binding protein 45 [Bombyx mandarina]|uniref:RRM domain-containing protein n=2 Tax=Bombyx TaxID=7090 RepID=A0A8R2DMH3_BOMMO|nr:RNA-binding protein 45 [Bombyx mori]XP_028029554.1 RNA-binding protein 45 [Bombyx mandarina]
MNHVARNDDKPPYSRIFIVCSKQYREHDLRPFFEKYGEIEDMYLPRDRNTGETRGIAYIKYAKTSSAATAIEELHMTTLLDNHKPIKVMVASDKNDYQSNSYDKYRRLFIKVPKTMTEKEIRQYFSSYGKVESVRLQRDKLTDESKGFAYVNFTTFSETAKAFEQCDKTYKAIFATPKDELKRPRNSLEGLDCYSSNSNLTKSHVYADHGHHVNDEFNKDYLTLISKTKEQDFDTVSVKCTPPVLQKHLERLFNIVPGMIEFKYTMDQGNRVCRASVTYDSQKAAAYSVETINNFEYPSGEVISVKPDISPLTKATSTLNNIVNNIKNSVDGNPNLLQLADAIAQASSLIKTATIGRKSPIDDKDDGFCNVCLPPIKPLASSNCRVAQRCFLVFRPHPPPMAALMNAFCRFGGLIEITTYPNKNFAFAKYDSVKSAQEAIKTLNGATLCGVNLKVLEAEEKNTKEKMCVDDDDDIERKRMKLNNKD